VRITVSIYNEAGERVGEVISNMVLDHPIEEFIFDKGEDVITETNPDVLIVFPEEGEGEPITLVWDGTGLDGEPLANGAYIVKVESVDSLGMSTVITGSAAILRSETMVVVRVYNEAGELIWTQEFEDLVVDTSDVAITGDTIDPALGTGVPGGVIEIELGEGQTPVEWDGKNQNGEPVANGEYIVEVQIIKGDEEAIFTETVTVLHGDLNVLDRVMLAPNPVVGGNQTEIRLPGLMVEVKIKVYTMAGELVVTLSGENTDGITWDLSNEAGSSVSGGVYLLMIESTDADGMPGKALKRLVIVR